MADILTSNNFNIVGEVPVAGVVTKAAQNDIVVLPHAGVRNVVATLYTGAAETTSYATLTVSGTFTAASTQIAYTGATADSRMSGGYYVITSSGEIMYVVKDTGYAGTSGTITVKRGALGTTASSTGVANGNTLYIMSSIVLDKSGTTGTVFLNYSPLPPDPNTKLYGA